MGAVHEQLVFSFKKTLTKLKRLVNEGLQRVRISVKDTKSGS